MALRTRAFVFSAIIELCGPPSPHRIFLCVLAFATICDKSAYLPFQISNATHDLSLCSLCRCHGHGSQIPTLNYKAKVHAYELELSDLLTLCVSPLEAVFFRLGFQDALNTAANRPF